MKRGCNEDWKVSSKNYPLMVGMTVKLIDSTWVRIRIFCKYGPINLSSWVNEFFAWNWWKNRFKEVLDGWKLKKVFLLHFQKFSVGDVKYQVIFSQNNPVRYAKWTMWIRFPQESKKLSSPFSTFLDQNDQYQLNF